jgi:hypothetical protein
MLCKLAATSDVALIAKKRFGPTDDICNETPDDLIAGKSVVCSVPFSSFHFAMKLSLFVV